MSPIKDLTLIYQSLNKENTFSEGDTIAGTVTLTLAEETKVKSLVVKVKGEARVHWTERRGKKTISHSDHRRYFKDKEYLVAENSNGRKNEICVICLLMLTLIGFIIAYQVTNRRKQFTAMRLVFTVTNKGTEPAVI